MAFREDNKNFYVNGTLKLTDHENPRSFLEMNFQSQGTFSVQNVKQMKYYKMFINIFSVNSYD